MIISKTISTYQVRFRQSQNYATDRASISCHSADQNTQLLIVFIGDDEEVGMARIDNLPLGRNRIVVYFPMSMFSMIHHVLQSEKPITVYANNNNDYTRVVFGSGDEPIGYFETSVSLYPDVLVLVIQEMQLYVSSLNYAAAILDFRGWEDDPYWINFGLFGIPE